MGDFTDEQMSKVRHKHKFHLSVVSGAFDFYKKNNDLHSTFTSAEANTEIPRDDSGSSDLLFEMLDDDGTQKLRQKGNKRIS